MVPRMPAADPREGVAGAARQLAQALTAAALAEARVLTVATRLGPAVASRDPDAVAQAVALQRDALAQVSEEQAFVRAALAELARRIGLPGEASLDALLTGLGHLGLLDEVGAVDHARQALLARTAETRSANAANALLLRQALAFTSLALRWLVHPQEPDGGYTARGPRNGVPMRVLDARV